MTWSKLQPDGSAQPLVEDLWCAVCGHAMCPACRDCCHTSIWTVLTPEGRTRVAQPEESHTDAYDCCGGECVPTTTKPDFAPRLVHIVNPDEPFEIDGVFNLTVPWP